MQSLISLSFLVEVTQEPPERVELALSGTPPAMMIDGRRFWEGTAAMAAIRKLNKEARR